TITNEDAPQLILTSRLQTVKLWEGRAVTPCLGYDLSNPTLSNFRFELDWDEVAQQCIANLEQEVEILRETAVEKYLEEEVSRYLRSARTGCLEGVSEGLEYTYENKEYHHTLYYYDQAGNLVQTVPP